MTWLTSLWDELRNSFWFLPAVFSLVAAVAAISLPQLDARVSGAVRERAPWLVTTVSAGQTTVSSIAGATVTVTGVVFSITMVTLSLTSSQLGPRLIRTFLDDLTVQVTLAAFVATSVYCLIVLRTIRGVSEDLGEAYAGGVVPHISVAAAVLFALVDLAVLVWFIHHTARAIQPSHVAQRVADDLDETIDRLFPEHVGRSASEVEPSERRGTDVLGGPAAPVPAAKDGYVRGVDEQALMDVSVEHDLVVRVVHRPGQFVVEGRPLAEIWPASRLDGQRGDALRESVADAFLVGRTRTPRQDLTRSLLELTEIAVRSLSPGINDPFTAVLCLDHLSATLSRLAGRTIPEPYRFDDAGRLRVVADPLTFPEALHAAFDPVRQYTRGSVVSTDALLLALVRVAAGVETDGQATAVARQASWVAAQCREGMPEEADRRRVYDRYGEVLRALAKFDLPDDLEPADG